MSNVKFAGVAGLMCVCAAVVLLGGCTGARFKGEKTASAAFMSPPPGTIGRATPVVTNGVAGDASRDVPSVSAFVDLESALATPAELPGTQVESRTRVIEAAPLGPRPVVRITSQRGWISVRPGNVGSVDVVAHVRATTPERYDAAVVVAIREADGSVTVRMDWPGTANVGESAGLEVTVPAAADVDVRTPDGRLSVAGLRGELFLRTGDGAIEVTDHRGPVRAETGGGRVDVVDVTGPVVVRSGGGDVTVVLTPGTPRLAGGAVGIAGGGVSGDAWQIAGADAKSQAAEAGLVDIDTASGIVRLTLTRDFAGELELGTGNGVVDVRDLAAARIISTGQRYMHVAIGDGGGKSRAVTGRGNVVVRVAQ